MVRNAHIIVGRSRDCDVVLSDASVSARHARLHWENGRIVIEDIGSANGTFVAGRRVTRAEVLSGEDVRFGSAMLPWSHRKLRAFLRFGASGETNVGPALAGRYFACGVCGARGLLPDGFERGELRCGGCKALLQLGSRARSKAPIIAALAAMSIAAMLVVLWRPGGNGSAGALLRVVDELRSSSFASGPVSREEASIRRHSAARVVAALDYENAGTRNAAVLIAAGDQGPFKVEQIARLWTHVRGRWRYVSDPMRLEYFARASETVENGFAGDCDDFATLLTAMLTSIGGQARVVMMDGPRGGHAYAEACVPQDAREVARRLSRYYRATKDTYLGEQPFDEMHFRSSAACPVWLNLDWNAGVPGGAYQHEWWAVAIYPDGHTETLAPAGAHDGPTAQ